MAGNGISLPAVIFSARLFGFSPCANCPVRPCTLIVNPITTCHWHLAVPVTNIMIRSDESPRAARDVIMSMTSPIGCRVGANLYLCGQSDCTNPSNYIRAAGAFRDPFRSHQARDEESARHLH
jgi:hypothetical protein